MHLISDIRAGTTHNPSPTIISTTGSNPRTPSIIPALPLGTLSRRRGRGRGRRTTYTHLPWTAHPRRVARVSRRETDRIPVRRDRCLDMRGRSGIPDPAHSGREVAVGFPLGDAVGVHFAGVVGGRGEGAKMLGVGRELGRVAEGRVGLQGWGGFGVDA